MASRWFLTCAFSAFLLGTFSASSLAAQSDWPPDDEPTYTVPTQQDSAAPQQYSYGQTGVGPQSGANGQQGYGSGYGQQGYGPQQGDAQGMSSDQLSQLVAPIALYPDSLVAQILTAATYPAQISAADRWLQGMKGAAPEQIAAGADAQTSWDPSVKALTAFPQVLQMLDQNLQWTSDLGSAYYNQPQDVLSTIQVLRQRAEQAGNLQPSEQEQVTDNEGYIAIAPQNPEMVYVPTYNPWAAYGQPIYPYPGFSFVGEFGSYFGSRVAFGLGYAMGPWFRAPFGWSRWDLDWRRDSIWFNHEAFWTHSREMRDWGFRYGGPRWRGGEGWGRGGERWGRDREGWGRGGDRSGNGGDWNRGGQMSRLSDYNHQPVDVHGGDGRRGRYPDVRAGNGFRNDGRQPGYSRGYPGQQTLDRIPMSGGRPQPYPGKPMNFGGQSYQRPFGGQTYAAPRGGYGSYPGGNRPDNFGAKNGDGFAQGFARPGGRGYAYSGGLSPRGGYASGGGFSRMPSPPSYGGTSRSGGFEGGRSAPSFGGGGHSFGGGGGSRGSFGGGHNSGGGRSFEGHSSGGGHSFGGEHSSGHSDGGRRR